MWSFISIIFSFFLTAIVGRYIAIRFTWAEHISKSRLERTQKDLELIEQINLNLIEKSSLRRYWAEQLISRLEECCDSNNWRGDTLIQDFRMNHQQSIKDWSISLSKNNIILNTLNISNIADDIEKSIHKNFSKSRILINEALKSESSCQRLQYLASSREQLDFAFGATRRISEELINIKNNMWLDFIENKPNTEPLTVSNLSRASILILFKALFYSRPDLLRIKSSSRR